MPERGRSVWVNSMIEQLKDDASQEGRMVAKALASLYWEPQLYRTALRYLPTNEQKQLLALKMLLIEKDEINSVFLSSLTQAKSLELASQIQEVEQGLKVDTDQYQKLADDILRKASQARLPLGALEYVQFSKSKEEVWQIASPLGRLLPLSLLPENYRQPLAIDVTSYYLKTTPEIKTTVWLLRVIGQGEETS